ncbi:leucine-rich repeat domain-containing protein [Anaerocolumna xylanovorans]|uniref:Leucine rich repeat-containing protein n=1 Tax=Anaerocolumna xylanovorans DSM 12503 TaxID=1121345 RepID=A0A1M7YFS2_9FIRM|nr:leucine-rich repeat domain-containing protein [Anaerocolumna xylanovorans]SHO51470.1 Leucine rich repeat-containing protein [Anaerocolumna xylanovorans DSM 12503]
MRKSVKFVLYFIIALTLFSLAPKTVRAASEYYLTKDNLKTYQGEEVFVFTENVIGADFLESWSSYPNVKEVIIAKGVTSFNWVFLTGHTFPNVEKVQISETVSQMTFISSADMGLSKLKSIEVAKNNANYTSDKGCLFNKNKTVLIQYPAASTNTSYVIPDTVTSINADAFRGADNLTTLTLGAKLGSNQLKNIRTLKNIKEFKVSKKNTAYSVKSGVIFNKKGDTLLWYPNGKGTVYSVPSGTRTIGENAFYNSKVKKVTLPQGLKTIEKNAFGTCTKLTAITIPKSVTKMEPLNFDMTGSLKTISVESGNKNYASYKGILYNAKKTEIISVPSAYKSEVLQFPSTLKSLDLSYYFKQSKEIVIPRDLTEIKYGADINYSKISLEKGNKKFTLYNGSLYSKDKTVLYLLKKQSKQEFPSALKNLSVSYYLKNSGVTELVIPQNAKFYDWVYIPTLKKITVAKDSKYHTMENGMVFNKDKTVLYEVPNDTKELIIPETVKKIDGNIFTKPNLTKIYIPPKVTDIYSGYLRWLKSGASIEVAPDNSAYTSIDGVLYNKDVTQLLYYPVNRQEKEYVMPDTVKSIAAVISENPYLESITLSAGLTVSDGFQLAYSKALKEIKVGAESTAFKTVDGVLYNKDMTQLLAYPSQKTDKAFSIPDTVITVSGFQCKEWVFKKGSDYYQYTYGSFSHPYLETLAVGKNVKELFYNSLGYGIVDFSSLKSVEVSEENPNYHMKDGILYNENYTTMYYYSKDRTDTILTIPSTVNEINYAFINAVVNNKYLQSIKVEDSKNFSTDGTALYNYAGNKLYFKLGDTEYLKSVFSN